MRFDLDPDRRLALAYIPARDRPAVQALWHLDAALASVLATGREEMIGRIRLAWWREALERLDREGAPAEPILQALATEVLPRGISGDQLAGLEAGWEALLSAEPLDEQRVNRFAKERGGRLVELTAQILGRSDVSVAPAGEVWALADLARHSAAGERPLPFALASNIALVDRWPTALRPLGMLAALAKRDLEKAAGVWERRGSPARMLTMIMHRLTGNV